MKLANRVIVVLNNINEDSNFVIARADTGKERYLSTVKPEPQKFTSKFEDAIRFSSRKEAEEEMRKQKVFSHVSLEIVEF